MRYSNILHRISYHAVYDESIMSALQYAQENGFSGVQIAVESPHLSFERVSDIDCEEIAEFAAKNNLRLVIHAPDESVSLFETSEYLLRGTFDYFGALFAFAESVNCKLITLHLGAVPAFGTDTVPKAIPEIDKIWHRLALGNNIQELLDLAAGRFTLCIENHDLESVILDLLQPYLDRGELALCWDLAKTYDTDGNVRETLEQFLLSNISHVRQVHLHDIAHEGGSHRVIGSGKLDFMRYLSLLSESDVEDYCIEVRPREKAAESLENLRKLVLQETESTEMGRLARAA